jgi:hypothetical protein
MTIIQNGQGLEIAVPPGQSIAVASLTGTYSATLLDGAGRGVLASASAGGATYGPYPAGATLRVKAGVDSCVAYDVGAQPVAAANPVVRYSTDADGNVSGLIAPNGDAPRLFDVFAIGGDDADEATQFAKDAIANTPRLVFRAGVEYPINDTILVPSNREVVIERGAIIKAVAGGPRGTSTFPIFLNENATSLPVSVESITPSLFGHHLVMCEVEFRSPHGITSDFVQIKGDGRNIYNGIWPIYDKPTPTSVRFFMSIAGGSTLVPPAAAVEGVSTSQTVANPGVFTQNGHEYVAGQAVQLGGSVPGGFAAGTVYYVIKAGLTATTYQLADSPFAASGKQVTVSAATTVTPMLIGAAADGNISIIGGGTLDMQYGTQPFTASNDWHDHAVILRRVRAPRVDLAVRAARKYCVMMQDVWHPHVLGLEGDTGSDGVHVYGPAWNPLIENVRGTFGDDPAVFQPVDGYMYPQYMLGTGFDLGGDFHGGTMRNIRPRHSHNTAAAVIYPNGNLGGGADAVIYRMRGQILIDGVGIETPDVYNGQDFQGWDAVGVGNGYVSVAGRIDSLVIRNVYGATRLNNDGGGTSLDIGAVSFYDLTGDLFYGDGCQIDVNYANIDQLTINGARHSPFSGGGLVTLQGSNAVIGALNFVGTQAGNPAATGTCYLLQTVGAPSVKEINFDNIRLSANGQALGPGSFTGTPIVNFKGGGGDGYKVLVEQDNNTRSLDINIFGFKSTSPTVGMFNFYGSDAGKTANVKLRVSGLIYSANVFANITGANFSVFNPDGSMPVDITTLTRTVAQTAVHSGATTAGTIIAGNLAICDATNAALSWKQLSNTALVY